MGNNIAKGVGEQLGELGKKIVTEVAKTPVRIVGLDETLGGTTSQQYGQTRSTKAKARSEKDNALENLKRKEEAEKQKQLAQARRILEQLTRPSQEEPSLKEKLELEELEKNKAEIEEERKKAKKILVQPQAKRPRGDLYGIKGKQFAGGVGKMSQTG